MARTALTVRDAAWWDRVHRIMQENPAIRIHERPNQLYFSVMVGGEEHQAADPEDLVGIEAPPAFAFSRDLTADVSGPTLQAHFRLTTEPTLVAEQVAIPRRRKRVQVWDANGVGLVVRWDGGGIVSWLQQPRQDGPPWTAQQFAAFNKVPLLS